MTKDKGRLDAQSLMIQIKIVLDEMTGETSSEVMARKMNELNDLNKRLREAVKSESNPEVAMTQGKKSNNKGRVNMSRSRVAARESAIKKKSPYEINRRDTFEDVILKTIMAKNGEAMGESEYKVIEKEIKTAQNQTASAKY